MAGRLTQSPEAVRPPVSTVTSRELPTPAALNELTYVSPDPACGIFTHFGCRNLGNEAGRLLDSPHRYDPPVAGMSASPIFVVQCLLKKLDPAYPIPRYNVRVGEQLLDRTSGLFLYNIASL